MLTHVKEVIAKFQGEDQFFKLIKRYYPRGDPSYSRIASAYNTAKKEFDVIQRENGDGYFTHLEATAVIIIAYLRVRDPDIICAALLHDICEDVQGWTQDRLELLFNRNVAQYVWWVSKPPATDFDGDLEGSIREYHQRFSHAPREAIIIKLADRLHNIITLWGIKFERQQWKVRETQDFYLPLAEKHTILIHELETAVHEVMAEWK